MDPKSCLIESDAQILVTGAGGFIGRRVVANLLERGFTKIRCLIRPSGNINRITDLFSDALKNNYLEIYRGNLLSREDCIKISENVKIIYHLAAGRGVKSYPDAYLNSVVTTRNLLDANSKHKTLLRFVNVSSFAVYSNKNKSHGRILDENCPLDTNPLLRGDAYSFSKVKQEELVFEYGLKFKIPFVSVRPGWVFGPGNEGIHGRVGIGSFGIFLHLGGSNKLPLTYVDNCADAIVLAGLIKDIDGEVFNVVDDNPPSSRTFLHLYKKHVRKFPSIYVPRCISYLLCFLWEKLSSWSHGQLPNSFNRQDWHVTWKKTYYTNDKIKQVLGWKQKIPINESLNLYFRSCVEKIKNA
jgi:nucleoside-diphosphate-sugar epimerase